MRGGSPLHFSGDSRLIFRRQVCASRPNGLLGCFWSVHNYLVCNKTSVFSRFKQTKRAIFLHLVCRKLLCTQQNRRICKARADQTGCSTAFGLLKITLYATKQAYLLDSSRPNGLFSCIWSAFLRKNKLNQGAPRKKTSRAFPNRQKTKAPRPVTGGAQFLALC